MPGLAEAAEAAGQTPLEYMRDRGAFAVPGDLYTPYEKLVSADAVADCTKDEHGVFRKPGTIGTCDGSDESLDDTELAKLGDGSPAVEVDGEIKEGFPTPSKKLELFSTTLQGLGLARVRHAEVDPEPRALGGPRHRRQRADPAARRSASRR